MIRYYLSPIIGQGTDEDPQRPAIADLGGFNWSAAVGTAAMACVLVNAPEAEHARLRGDARSWAFPVLFAPIAEVPTGSRESELRAYHEHGIAPIIRNTLVNRVQEMLGLSLEWLDPGRHNVGDVLDAVLLHIEGPSAMRINLWVGYP